MNSSKLVGNVELKLPAKADGEFADCGSQSATHAGAFQSVIKTMAESAAVRPSICVFVTRSLSRIQASRTVEPG